MKLRTAKEAKKYLEETGISVSQFARTYNLPQDIVYKVLTGKIKGKRGYSHNAAVLLGIKKGVIAPLAVCDE